MRKTPREKIETSPAPKVEATDKGLLLIPSPAEIEGIVKKIPKGKLLLSDDIRAFLANKYKAEWTCPLCTGIFFRIVAEAAEDEKAEGRKEIAPYWRVLKTGGKLNEKFPGGIENHASLLKAEGFTLIPGKGKQPPKVADYEKSLVKL